MSLEPARADRDRARRPPRCIRPRSPLSSVQERAAQDAGGWSLALTVMGVNLVIAVGAVVLCMLLVRWIISDLVGSEAWGADVLAGYDGLPFGVLVPWGVAALAVAALLVSLGAWVSVRRLGRAGVEPAGRITRIGMVHGTLVQLVLDTIASWMLGLLSLLTGVVSLFVLVGIFVVLSTALSGLIGWLAGPRMWLRHARRLAPPRPASPAPPLPPPPSRLGTSCTPRGPERYNYCPIDGCA